MTTTKELQSVDYRMNQLQAEFDAQVASPQGEDPRIGAFYVGLRDVFFEPSLGLDKIYSKAFERRPDLTPIHASGLARAAIQKLALRRADVINFPADFVSGEDYSDLIIYLLHHRPNLNEFKQDIFTRSVQTNVADRGKGPKLLAMYYAERFNGRPLNIIDLGCGQNHLPKMMALTELRIGADDDRDRTVFRYGHTIVNRFLDADPAGIVEEDDELTEKFNTKLRMGGLAIGECLGIDKERLKRGKDIEWIRSSFYLRELLMASTIEEFDLVEGSDPPQVKFRRLDILDLAKAKDPRRLLKGFIPDIAITSFMFYQLTPQQQEIAQHVIHSILNPDGVAIHVGPARVPPENPSQLEVLPNLNKPYSTSVIVDDMREPGNLQEILRARSGRFGEVVLGTGHLNINGRHQTLEELLRNDSAAKT